MPLSSVIDKMNQRLMFILASDFFEKDDKYVFKTRNSCCEQRILAFEYVLIDFCETNQMINYVCVSEILKTRV